MGSYLAENLRTFWMDRGGAAGGAAPHETRRGFDMARQDNGSPDALRADLRHFAQLVLRLERDGRLLEATPQLLKLLGDLRAKLFAYEVRCAASFQHDASRPEVTESERIVREAIDRVHEAEREWERGWDTAPDE